MLSIVKQSRQIKKEEGHSQCYHCAHGVGDGGGNSEVVFGGEDLPDGGNEGEEEGLHCNENVLLTAANSVVDSRYFKPLLFNRPHFPSFFSPYLVTA